ncbi:MFS transporter, partial [Streptomyces albidoflavus]
LLIPFTLRFVGVRTLGIFGLSLLCICLISIGWATSMLLYGAAFVAAMLGVTYFNVFNRTQRIRVLPQEHLGKVMGPFYLLNMLALPLAGLLVAGFGSSLGPQRLVAILAILLTVFGAIMLPLTIRAFSRAFAAQEKTLVGASAE